MKANSVGWEMSISLTKEELKRLKESPLVGKIKRHRINENSSLDEIPITLKIGETSKENECLDIATIPPNVYWEHAKEYHITLSNIAYSELKERGFTGERIYNNPSCKILIRLQNGPEGI